MTYLPYSTILFMPSESNDSFISYYSILMQVHSAKIVVMKIIAAFVSHHSKLQGNL